MRILLDGYWWVEGPTSNRNVLRPIVTTWSERFPDDELVLAIPARHRTPRPAAVPDAVQLVSSHLRPHALAAMFELPVLARRRSADAVLTHNFTPLLGPSAVFVHDVIFQTNPEWFTYKERLYFALMPLSAPRASVVLSSTMTEARRIGRENPRVKRVVPVGIGPSAALLESTPQPPPALADLRDFFLCVGRANPRKNVAVAVEAAVQAGVLSREHPLVVVGEGEHGAMTLTDTARQAADAGHIRFLRFVPDAQLAWLYRNARLMIFLSLDEGFGLPPVEALALGAAVLVSDIEVFHETMGDRASYVSPTDTAAVAQRLRELAVEEPRRSPQPSSSWTSTVERIRAEVVRITT
jgi:glycosyltransferase involved in cell wall biosynthesis